MKQVYEAEILYRLMERDGFNIPSSVPPYESEIIAYLINQVKLSYPKLTDYEAEWLLYNYTQHLPADFPISTATNVTSAHFENVVPFAYQSAILKGQTLVNIFQFTSKDDFDRSDALIIEGTTMKFNGDGTYQNFWLKNNGLVKANTNYLFIVDILENTLEYQSTVSDTTPILYLTSSASGYNDENLFPNGVSLTVNDLKKSRFIKKHTSNPTITGTESIVTRSFLSPSANSGSLKFKMMIIEYQGGMENWDITYFTGMQSVQMPGLKTVGKNLYNKTPFNGYVDSSSGKFVSGSTTRKISDYIEVEPNKKYKVSGCTMTTMWGYDKDKNPISVINIYGDITTTSDMRFIAFTINSEVEHSNIQLEEGTVATSYEPYKSITLSSPSDLELRGVGDVRDELNCLTGEVTEHIKTTTLDKFTKWITHPNVSEGFSHFTVNVTDISTTPHALLCDSLPAGNIIDVYNGTSEGLYHSGNKYLHITIKTDKLSENSINGLNQYLNDNIVTIQYPLATPTIKTVDLTTVNEKGETVYFMPIEGTMNTSSSSETIQPTFDMSVPVEATTQNLASFINMELEE